VLIWLSRYRASALPTFIKALRSLLSLEIVTPKLEDQEAACNTFGKLPLGLSDLVSLATMKRLNIEEIYTPDKGFEEGGVRVIFHELAQKEEFKRFTDFLKTQNYSLNF